MLMLTPQAICRELRSLQQIEIQYIYRKLVKGSSHQRYNVAKSLQKYRPVFTESDQAILFILRPGGRRGTYLDSKNLHSVVGSIGGCTYMEGESSGVTVDRSDLSQYVYSADLAVFECSEHRL